MEGMRVSWRVDRAVVYVPLSLRSAIVWEFPFSKCFLPFSYRGKALELDTLNNNNDTWEVGVSQINAFPPDTTNSFLLAPLSFFVLLAFSFTLSVHGLSHLCLCKRTSRFNALKKQRKIPQVLTSQDTTLWRRKGSVSSKVISPRCQLPRFPLFHSVIRDRSSFFFLLESKARRSRSTELYIAFLLLLPEVSVVFLRLCTSFSASHPICFSLFLFI